MDPLDYQNLKRVFSKFDSNDSNALNLSEFDNLIKAIGLNWSSNDVNKLFRKFDKNNSDLIEFEEFIDCMSKYFAYPDVKLLVREFQRFDLDGSGFITIDEIFKVLSQFKRIDTKLLDRKRIEESLKNSKIDVNNDGKISLEEFSLNKQSFFSLLISAPWLLTQNEIPFY